MTKIKRFTFPKEERLCLKKEIDLLFERPDLRLNRFPLLFLIKSNQRKGPVRTLISIPKRKVRKAVMRNLIRRRIREVYRMNKHILNDVLPENSSLDVAIIYVGSGDLDLEKVEKALISILNDTVKRIPEIY